MRAVADGIARLFQRRHEIKGLRFIYEPPAWRQRLLYSPFRREPGTGL